MLSVPNRGDGLAHVITIEDDIDHMYMMNYKKVQGVLAQILQITPQQAFAAWIRPDMVTTDEFDAFLQRMPQPRGKMQVPEEIVRKQIFDYLAGFRLKDLQQLAWRGFTDLLR